MSQDFMHNKRFFLAILVAALTAGPVMAGTSPQTADKGLLKAIHGLKPEAEERYFFSSMDLNGDGRKEAIVYLIGPHSCGSGGCHTAIFSPEEKSGEYRLVTLIELTRPPIIAARSKTNGWRDLIVFVQGGGILEGYDVLLPFDGAAYPESPFLESARPLQGEIKGDVLIDRHSYEEAAAIVQP
jgi:hypothetical protein